MKRLACLLAIAAAGLASCGGDDDAEGPRAQEQAKKTAGKTVLCSQKGFLLSFDENEARIRSGSQTLATLTGGGGTVSGKCTTARDRARYDERGLKETIPGSGALNCVISDAVEIALRGGAAGADAEGANELVVAVRGRAIASVTLGGGARYTPGSCTRGTAPSP